MTPLDKRLGRHESCEGGMLNFICSNPRPYLVSAVEGDDSSTVLMGDV